MAKSETIIVNGVEYVLKGTIISDEPKNSDIKIVILQRGWVMIGRYSQEGDKCTLENAYVIRRWGTSKGLGELALEGKKSGTIMDRAGRVEFNALTVVATINAKPELWTKELA
jgi:hypothetical protein